MLKITPKINQAINNIKRQRQEKLINKHVDIENVSDINTYRALYKVRDGLANYAKYNNVKIQFSTPKHYNYGYQNPLEIKVARELKEKFKTVGEHREFQTIDGDVNSIHTVIKNSERMLENKDGLNYIVKTENRQQDNFLRQVYRNVEFLTKELER